MQLETFAQQRDMTVDGCAYYCKKQNVMEMGMRGAHEPSSHSEDSKVRQGPDCRAHNVAEGSASQLSDPASILGVVKTCGLPILP